MAQRITIEPETLEKIKQEYLKLHRIRNGSSGRQQSLAQRGVNAAWRILNTLRPGLAEEWVLEEEKGILTSPPGSRESRQEVE